MGNNKKGHQPEKPKDDIEPKVEPVQDGKVVTPLVDALGELFEKYGVKTAVAAFELPDSPGPAHVFYVGHFYEVAKMNAMVNRQFIDQVRKELG